MAAPYPVLLIHSWLVCHLPVIPTCGHSGRCSAKVIQARFQNKGDKTREKHRNAGGGGLVESLTAANGNDSLDTNDTVLNTCCEVTGRGFTHAF